MAKRTLVVTDIHGCYTELRKLLKQAKYNGKKDKLISLGDNIDRGEQSWEVVKYLQCLQERHGKENVVLLKGNHEDTLVEALDYTYLKGWNAIGGTKTSNSYKEHNKSIYGDLSWFRDLPIYHEDENFYYVHAGFKPNVAIKDQSEGDMLWIREEFYESKFDFGKTVIFGHSPTLLIYGCLEPIRFGNNICIDTGCIYNGRLSCLEIVEGEITKVYQVDREIPLQKKEVI